MAAITARRFVTEMGWSGKRLARAATGKAETMRPRADIVPKQPRPISRRNRTMERLPCPATLEKSTRRRPGCVQQGRKSPQPGSLRPHATR
ncbi:protein of unknown function [Aminobacter niigataensis]|nr:protein of unknown function [Aminobacter niigataensis]